jgi:CRISPR-associated protein Csy1
VTNRSKAIRTQIKEFVKTHHKGKEAADWVPRAAKLANQTKICTHAAKFIHPDARSTNVLLADLSNKYPDLVGTHSLGEARVTYDATGGAAGLGAAKFLLEKYEGKPYWQMVRDRDEDFGKALSDDLKERAQLLEGFAQALDDTPRSHARAKQVYSKRSDESDVLLSIEHPAALTAYMCGVIEISKFSDTAKEAREAKREGKPFDHEAQEYWNLLATNYGGSQPQNVSICNSKHRGRFLLCSVPPTWKSSPVRIPLKVKTVFHRYFDQNPKVRHTLYPLRRFLAKTTNYSNMRIRQTRQEMVENVVDEVLQVVAEVGQYDPGWSASEECLLDAAESFWLDPLCVEDDQDLTGLHDDAWQATICERFAMWLNRTLQTKTSPMGDDEYDQWFKAIKSVI